MGSVFKIPLLALDVARLTVALCCIGLAGCATVGSPPQPQGLALEDGQDCAGLFRRYEALVADAGAQDSFGYRIPGFPYLRVDRFLASFRTEAGGDGKRFEAWLRHLQDLAAQVRRYELANLLPVSRAAEAEVWAGRLDECAHRLADADLTSARRRADLLEQAQAPDEYSELARVLGLYPLTRIPFYAGVERWQQDTLERFRQPGPTDERVIRYVPAGSPAKPDAIRQLLAQTPRDALGIPRFTPATLDVLFDAYAPVFEIETTGDFDRIGALVWQGDASPAVEPARPTVYRRLAFTRLQGEVLVQLVYTVWFSERPASGAFDLLSGRLDGVVFRVSLDGAGRPLVYDSIHPCGCYHLFFPAKGVEAKPSPGGREEWAFIPKNAPELQEAQRLGLSVASRSHYLVGLRPNSGRGGVAYSLALEDDLRSLRDGRSDSARSVYDAEGIVPGTERKERFLFWPMGIAHPGAMRQWGKHATAFVGRRHFDDADLIEKRFSIKP